MNINNIDLNLLVYLDVLLEEKNVTKAASQLGITQPAMSNGLKRLRTLFGDPLLVRTSEGMTPTERALALRPVVREALSLIEQTVQPQEAFQANKSNRVFRIMASDYVEATLIPSLVKRLAIEAPEIRLDILTPSDVVFQDVEQGKIDLAINRFSNMPNSFHQKTVWFDNFSCLLRPHHPLAENFNLENYLAAQHIWVSKTGMGKGIGITPSEIQRFGRVDEALDHVGLTRHIGLFTRNYQTAVSMAMQSDMIATIPTMLALMCQGNPAILVRKPPFSIPPFELKIAWSPLLHHNHGHRWLRQMIIESAQSLLELRNH
jgi:DNA-binding transcriptional LysR family regulator